jgi:hypothetical protein
VTIIQLVCILYTYLYLSQRPFEIIRRQLVHHSVIRRLMAVSLVHEQTVLARLKRKLNIRRDEVNLALPELRLDAVCSHSSTALGRKQNSVAANLLKRLLLATLESHLQHVEFAHGWCEDLGLAVLAALVGRRAKHAVFGAVDVERQGRDEEVCGSALGFRAEAGVEHVVAARHAFDDVAGQIAKYSKLEKKLPKNISKSCTLARSTHA